MKRILFMVLCLMVISGLFLVSCKKQETPQTEETVTETEGYGEKAKEAVSGYGEKAKEAVSGYGEKAKEAVSGYGEKAKEAVSGYGEEGKERIGGGYGEK